MASLLFIFFKMFSLEIYFEPGLFLNVMNVKQEVSNFVVVLVDG